MPAPTPGASNLIGLALGSSKHQQFSKAMSVIPMFSETTA